MHTFRNRPWKKNTMHFNIVYCNTFLYVLLIIDTTQTAGGAVVKRRFRDAYDPLQLQSGEIISSQNVQNCILA